MGRKVLRATAVWSGKLSPQTQVALAGLQLAVKKAGLELGKAVLRSATIDVVIEAGCRVATRYLDEVLREVETINREHAAAPPPASEAAQ